MTAPRAQSGTSNGTRSSGSIVQRSSRSTALVTPAGTRYTARESTVQKANEYENGPDGRSTNTSHTSNRGPGAALLISLLEPSARTRYPPVRPDSATKIGR